MPIYNPGPQIAMPPIRGGYVLSFYDGTASETQLYSQNDILGFGKGTNQLIIYMKGARDVNAKDTITITLNPTTITADRAQVILMEGIRELNTHPSNEVIKKVVAPLQGDNDFVHEFASCTIAYGTCCSGGGGDTYTLEASAKAGSNVPLLLDAASGSDSTVNLTEGTNITLTRNSATQVTIDASVPTLYHQINNHNLFLSSWDMRDPYLFPILEDRGSGFYTGKNIGSAVSPGSYPSDEAFKWQTNLERATSAWDRVSWYNLSMANMTAAAIAALGTGGQVKAVLYRYSPSAGDSTFNYTTQILGDIDFNATANRVQINAQTTNITLSVGDLFFIGYQYTVTAESASGNITNLRLQTTGRFWKS
tara:strand:- start:867 stop:1961 length:1095 start_codon:yes stop_codon:yes gene_type:complete